MERPRRLDGNERRLWKAYRDLFQRLSSVLEDELEGDAGQSAVDDVAPEHSAAVRRYFFDPLSREELTTFERLIDRLLENLAPGKE